MSTTTIGQGYKNNRVGPVIRACDISRAIVEAAREDNPDSEIVVDDQIAYVRIYTDRQLVIRRESIEEALGRPFLTQSRCAAVAFVPGSIRHAKESM